MKINATSRLSALSSVLYHITTIEAATSILKSDRFELTASSGIAAEDKLQTSGKAYYLSTARSVRSSYLRSRISSDMVLLVLDGSKLSNRYSGKAVDYWGAGGNASQDEMEDRVYSKSPFIPHALSYVKAAHFIVPSKVAYGVSNMLPLVTGLKLKHIPVYFYESEANLLTLSTAKRVPVPMEVLRNIERDDRHEVTETRDRSIKYSSTLRWALMITMDKATKEKMSKAARDVLEGAIEYLRYDDAIGVFESDMHNARQSSYGDARKDREHGDLIVAYLRKYHLTPKQFISNMADKWLK